jgi:hypothetical protein
VHVLVLVLDSAPHLGEHLHDPNDVLLGVGPNLLRIAKLGTPCV